MGSKWGIMMHTTLKILGMTLRTSDGLSSEEPEKAAARRLRRRRVGRGMGVAFLAASLLLTGCAGTPGTGKNNQTNTTDNTSDEDAPGKFDKGTTMETIQKRGKIIVGMRTDAAPFAYRDSNTGTLQGFDVEIAKLVGHAIFGAQLENKIQYVPLDPRDRELALEQNKVDIAMGRYEITVARKKFVDFAGPYYEASQQLIADSRGSQRYDNLIDMAGRKVCVVKGSTDVDALLREAPGADVSTVKDTVQQCAVALNSSQVEGIAADYIDIQSIVSGGNFRAVGRRYDPAPYGIGVHRGTTDLRQYINDLLEGRIQAQWSEIYQRTIGTSGSNDQQPQVDRY